MTRTYHTRLETVHGYRVMDHPLYSTWAGMKSRCNSDLENYGGRGISYCPQWEDFKTFALDMGLRPDGTSLERVDNNGDYTPSNCRWATGTEQCVNRRTFKNNTSGHTGVLLVRGRYKASFQYEGVTYNVSGTFETATEARDKRKEVLQVFAHDKERAKSMCVRVARSDSTTGTKGVSRHTDGIGFTARYTLPTGERKYLGLFETIQAASEAITKFEKTGEDSKDPIRRRTTTGVKGVSFSKGGFLVKPYLDKKRHYVGKFKTLDEAKVALDAFMEKYNANPG